MIAKILLKIAIFAILIFVGWALVVSFFSFFRFFRPAKLPISKTPADLGFDFEEISFLAKDGKKLSGWFLPAREKSEITVLLFHGYQGNKQEMLSFAEFLHPKYNLFLFDFRAHGESSGHFTSIGFLEIRDVLGAIDYLKNQKKEESQKIGVLGFSLGAAVGIMAAKDSPEIKAIVADSSYASFDRMVFSVYRVTGFMKKPMTAFARFFGKFFFKIDIAEVSPKEAVKKIKTPILLIHGELDKEISIEDPRMIFQAASGPKEIWEAKGSSHGQAYFLEKEIYQEKVLTFFEKYLD